MFTREVKVTFKDPKNKAKKYVFKRPQEFFENLEEASTELGKHGLLSAVNRDKERQYKLEMHAKLKAKVLGKGAPSDDITDMSDILD